MISESQLPRKSIPGPSDGVLRWSIDEPAPARIAVGGGSAFPITGWCFHRERPIRNLEFVVGGDCVPSLAHSLPRPDVHGALFPDADPLGHSYASGFLAVLPLTGIDRPQTLEVELRATLAGGGEEQVLVDRIELRPGHDAEPNASLGGARIAICMATHDPDYELFARQIESIVAQSLDGWRCLISDDRSPPQTFDRMVSLLAGDDRFVIDRGPRRLGAYHNFERALSSVGRDVELVALADQDDCWHGDKLEALAASLGNGALLAYSDCRIVRPNGTLLSNTFFPVRQNNCRDLRSLVVANTVTGAATMLRRELLDDALPFPPYTTGAFHDHWLACVALALGDLAYVDRPLWDYVQHGENLLGHAIGQRLEKTGARGEWMLHHRVVYLHLLMRTVALAEALELRLGGRMSREKRGRAARIAKLERSPAALAALALRAASERPATSSTLGLERELLGAMVWRRRMSLAARRRNKGGDMRFSSTMSASRPTVVSAADVDGVGAFAVRTAPLPLAVSASEPRRINIFLGTPGSAPLREEHGTWVNLAAWLAANGTRTRLVLTDGSAQLPAGWREWTDPPTHIELTDATDRSQPLAVSPNDRFAATSWWTARIAHAAAGELGESRFLYLIREYESPSGQWAAEAEATYRLPHNALFCSETIRAHFQVRQLGIYGSDGDAGGQTAPFFDEPIRFAAPPMIDQLLRRTIPRLLFYAPLGADVPSMPELGILALERAAQAGLLDGWEVNAVGLQQGLKAVELAAGCELSIIDSVDLETWPELLRGHDVGLALAATARPSLASFEMAAAGLVTVTNTLGVKDRAWLMGKSENLIAVDPTGDAILEGLRAALERSGDTEARVAGSSVRWPTSWEQALDSSLSEQLSELIAVPRIQSTS